MIVTVNIRTDSFESPNRFCRLLFPAGSKGLFGRFFCRSFFGCLGGFGWFFYGSLGLRLLLGLVFAQLFSVFQLAGLFAVDSYPLGQLNAFALKQTSDALRRLGTVLD